MTVGRCFTPVSVRDGYYVRFDHVAQDTYPFWTRPDNQCRPVVLHDASNTASLSLTIATCSTGLQRLVRRIPPFLSRFSRLKTSRPGGDNAVSLTIEALGLDVPFQMGYHLTNINLQLLKNSWWPFFTAHPPTRQGRFRTNESHQIVVRERPSCV